MIGFWLCFAAAEARRALVAGPAAGMATLMACLAMLSQSRGTALAMLFALVAVVAVVPGRTRRIYGLLVVAGAWRSPRPTCCASTTHSAGGSASVEAGHVAGRAALLAAIAAGLAWGLLTLGVGAGCLPARVGLAGPHNWILAACDPDRGRAGRGGGAPRSVSSTTFALSGTPLRISPNQASAPALQRAVNHGCCPVGATATTTGGSRGGCGAKIRCSA